MKDGNVYKTFFDINDFDIQRNILADLIEYALPIFQEEFPGEDFIVEIPRILRDKEPDDIFKIISDYEYKRWSPYGHKKSCPILYPLAYLCLPQCYLAVSAAIKSYNCKMKNLYPNLKKIDIDEESLDKKCKELLERKWK